MEILKIKNITKRQINPQVIFFYSSTDSYHIVDDLEDHNLHVEDLVEVVRVLSQLDELLHGGRIVLLKLCGHPEAGDPNL